MIAVISPGKIIGNITAPASKSVMQRVCALALLNNGRTVIQNPGKSNDDLAALNIIKELGADFFYEKGCLVISSNGTVNGNRIIHCGESGLSLRMFAPIAALSSNEILLNGEGSLLRRPMNFFNDVFPLLGVSVKPNKGVLPITIKGPLIPKNITIDGSQSSQYLTGLLFAFAKTVQTPVVITVHGLKSKPYIDLSIQMLAHFGYDVKNEGYTSFSIKPARAIKRDIVFYTEGDWSSAAFLLVAGAIAGNVRVEGLDIYSAQADRAIMDVLADAGASISVDGSCVLVNDQHQLNPFTFDASDCPDLFPPLTVLAAYCKGVSVIKGISRLAGKESDRAISLMDVFSKMGIEVSLNNDDMIIRGGTGVHSAEVSSHHDHRIAMACAVAALRAGGDIAISNAEAINKSYPDFYHHLQMLSVTVSLA